MYLACIHPMWSIAPKEQVGENTPPLRRAALRLDLNGDWGVPILTLVYIEGLVSNNRHWVGFILSLVDG